MSRLKVTDNWGRLTYLLDGEKVDATRGGEALVRWPDGSTGSVAFVARTVWDSVSDHGHDDRFQDNRLIALVDHHGLVLEVPLQRLDVLQIVR